MRLSSLADYAVIMLAAAARHAGATRLTANLLADETGVPLPTAQKLMGRLASAGLLSSARGTGGGEAISLADIIEAVEGPIAMSACVEDGRHDCGLEEACRVKPHWPAVNNAVKGALDGVSLASLAATPYNMGTPA
jgi:Rrf2 family protein